MNAGHQGLILRPMILADVPAVVDVHLRAFPGFFLSFLGPRFLREFYRSFLRDPRGVAFVAEETGTNRILGVAAGPISPDGFFRSLLVRRWWAFLVASAGPLVRNPGIVPRLARAVSYRGEPPAGPKRALLSTIAVAPELRRRGIGLSLIGAWSDAVRTRGAQGCYLTTDAVSNDPVNRFYERAGWTRAHTLETPEGRRMILYTHDFTPVRV